MGDSGLRGHSEDLTGKTSASGLKKRRYTELSQRSSWGIDSREASGAGKKENWELRRMKLVSCTSYEIRRNPWVQLINERTKSDHKTSIYSQSNASQAVR